MSALDALEDAGKAATIPEIQTVLDAAKGVKRSTLRKVTDQDSTQYGELADTVAKAGQKVAASYVGKDWSAVDVTKKSKGKVYQP